MRQEVDGVWKNLVPWTGKAVEAWSSLDSFLEKSGNDLHNIQRLRADVYYIPGILSTITYTAALNQL